MDNKRIQTIFEETAYVRFSGTPEEHRCAAYLQDRCAELGLQTRLEAFTVDKGEIQQAELWCDGEAIPCTGYLFAAPGTVEAPLYYLNNTDPWSMSQCKGKIVLSDKLMSYWHYQDLYAAGALGFITYNGNANFPDEDLEQRELRTYVSQGKRIPGVHVHAKTAIRLVEQGVQTAKIVLQNTEYPGTSYNVIADLPGETEETIVFTAHYDTTPLSVGIYDNMSGSVGLLMLAEYFLTHPHRRSLRFIWCGSEERGLLGSKAYVADHEAELEQTVLNINLDMIGCTMGKLLACCTSEEKLVHYLSYFAQEVGVGLDAHQGVYSSDSTPLADKGVPAVSFARIAPPNTFSIHSRYDTAALMKPEQLQTDMAFVAAFADRMANACRCPVARVVPENMQAKLDEYLNRKRPK